MTAADRVINAPEGDLASREASIHAVSPKRYSSVKNTQPHARRGNSIQTISQSAGAAELRDRENVAGPVPSPTVPKLPKHRLEHIHNGSDPGTNRSNR